MIQFRIWALVGLMIVGFGCGGPKAPLANSPSKTSLDEALPFTMATIRGHQMLFDEGWFVVSSSKDAWAYAKKKSFMRSGESMKLIAKDIGSRTRELGSDVSEDIKTSYDQSVGILGGGTTLSGVILAGSWELTGAEFDFASDHFQEAYQHFVQGNISIVKRSGRDLIELKSLPGSYFAHLKEDFSNIRDLSSDVNRQVSENIALSWDASFEDAASAFKAEYEQSGTRENTLSALGDILSGYLKAFYEGLAKPGAKSLVEYGTKGASTGLFLPGAAVTVISGRTIEATGLSLYYGAKTGYHVIAPTVEAGFLGSLALVSAVAAPVTLAGGAGLGAVNQVAFTAASPVYMAGKSAVDTTVDTGKYMARVSYDVTKRSSHVLIDHASSAVVLGYNALTAVPVHLFLGTVDTVVFLGLDGPRLVIAVARGRVGSDHGKGGYSVGALPAGTVIDLEKLKNQPGLEIEVVTDDPEIIENVLNKLPEDLRGNNED
ncbi:MAG: hypothetical protein KKD44_04245 [Proteobacteria bacterium]|nr:hypothetical protein [Pseudomonadota bacterium]